MAWCASTKLGLAQQQPRWLSRSENWSTARSTALPRLLSATGEYVVRHIGERAGYISIVLYTRFRHLLYILTTLLCTFQSGVINIWTLKTFIYLEEPKRTHSIVSLKLPQFAPLRQRGWCSWVRERERDTDLFGGLLHPPLFQNDDADGRGMIVVELNWSYSMWFKHVV